jgi:hypothetical protein
MTALKTLVFSLIATPSVLGLWYVLILYRRAKKTTTSVQTMAILDRLYIVSIGLTIYAAAVVPLSMLAYNALP